MYNKQLIIGIVIVVVAGGLLWFANMSQEKISAEKQLEAQAAQDLQDSFPDIVEEDLFTEEESPTPAPQPAPQQPTTNETGGTFSAEPDITAPDISVFEVVYDGESFAPASLSVRAGDIVFFENQSSAAFRPASDPHPSHAAYPGFDAGKEIAAGQRFEFKFTKAGSWGYHNHLNPSAKGTITVMQ